MSAYWNIGIYGIENILLCIQISYNIRCVAAGHGNRDDDDDDECVHRYCARSQRSAHDDALARPV